MHLAGCHARSLALARGADRNRTALATLPFFAVAIGLGLITVLREAVYFPGGAAGYGLSFLDSCLIAGRALWFYAFKLIAPIQLTAIYPRWQIDPGDAAQWAFPLAAGALAFVLFSMRRRIGWAPLVGGLFFALTLAPVLSFVEFGFLGHSFVADRYQYLACLGPLAALAHVVGPTFAGKSRAATAFGGIGLALLAAMLGTLTWRQARIYENAELFWSHSIEQNPTATAYAALGEVYRERGELEVAETHLLRSLELSDHFLSHSRLGLIYMEQEKALPALAQLRRSLELLRASVRLPDQEARILFNIGSVL